MHFPNDPDGVSKIKSSTPRPELLNVKIAKVHLTVTIRPWSQTPVMRLSCKDWKILG